MDVGEFSMNSHMDGSAPPAQTVAAQFDAAAQDKTTHPVAVFFHLFFKGAALFCFTILRLLTDSFIVTFIVCVFALAFDFWVVKNVTGRLLVGLRWWNEILEDGSNKWIFESRADNKVVSRYDSLMFWGGIYLTPPCWVVLGLLFSGFQLQWLIVVVIALVLSCANLAGYWKCQKDASKRLRNFLTQQAVSVAVNNMQSGAAAV